MERTATMLRQLAKLFSRKEKSGDTARRRLRMVLVLDRIGLAPEHLNNMKDEIFQVVSNYMVVDLEGIELEVRRTADSVMLVSNIPVKDILRREAEPQQVG